MKKITIVAILALTLGLGYSFKTIHDLQKTTAEVSGEDGILVFLYSTPLTKYRIIGNVKEKGLFKNSSKIEDHIFELSQKTKKNYPTGEGLIVKINSFGYEADVIEFIK